MLQSALSEKTRIQISIVFWNQKTVDSRRSVSLVERWGVYNCSEHALVVRLCWKLNSTLFQPVSFSLFSSHLRFFLPYPRSRLESFFINNTIFRFSSYIFSSSFRSFSSIYLLSGVLSQFPIIRFRGFLLVIWSFFKAYQLFYGARIFLLVSKFFSLVSFIKLGGFLSSSYSSFPSSVLYSAELAS